MLNNPDSIIHDILDEGLNDWVPVDRIIGGSRALAASEGSDFRQIASAVIEKLIRGGLMVPGVIGSSGFEAWAGSTEELVERVMSECEGLSWAPFGAGCWMANTEKGDSAARA
jgi:hypothetical protein